MKRNFKKNTSRTAAALLAPAAYLSSFPAFSALPVIAPPTGGSIGGGSTQEGDFLGILGAYFKLGATILGLVLAAWAFLNVVSGAMGKWKEYTAGRASIGDLKEFFIMGVVLVAFIVMMVKYAMETMA